MGRDRQVPGFDRWLIMARWEGKTTDRGLGGKHQADKKRLLAALRPGEPCWRCGKPMWPHQNLHRDHIVDRALGGANGPAVLAHAHCNLSAGAAFGNRLRAARRRQLARYAPRASRQW